MVYSDLRKIAFVGDYLPRKCGIATFTHDLRSALAQFTTAECIVVPVDDMTGGTRSSRSPFSDFRAGFEVLSARQISSISATSMSSHCSTSSASTAVLAEGIFWRCCETCGFRS